MGLYAEEGADNGSDDNEKNTATEPCGGDFAGIVVAAVPLLVNFYSADKAHNGADSVHEICTSGEITSYHLVSLIDTGITILSRADKGCKERHCH
ncbi:MAG TPA: hypothetical protein VMR70_15765 [Flavisolibacter sp.]|nr:hypothetical protein [Flavisolibacter sp.]